MSLPRLGIRTRARAAFRAVRDLPHRRRARALAGTAPSGYDDYIDVQVRRTLAKRLNDPGAGARVLADELVRAGALGAASEVLCVGCRNAVELDLLRERGVGSVVGIDLVSQRHDILVMDMHAITFADASFDAVYASHSLEHAFDAARVVAELGRVVRPGGVVAVEVPLGAPKSTADRLAFSGLDDLRRLLEPVAATELWAEEQPAGTERNEQGTPIARLVVRVAPRD